ncbi:AAA family ATPase [Pseudanabaena sp. FACHB-1050]|uniref:AAA family ATPase n=2 Tax=Phormidium tenue TaxID=126344 RepID=A0ABR8CB51_9CYAN|nr:AAA family ATPase [Phormidium tenue FACHB-1050]
MTSDRIDRFQASSRNLQLLPLLSDEERENFWVDHGSDCIDRLEQKVLDCNESNNQIMFAGHRGCGKSTLLFEFSQIMQDRYFTVFFSISDFIQMKEVNHINILFVIALKMMEKAERDHVKIADDKKQAFFDWFKERTTTETVGVSGQMSVGINLLEMIKANLSTEQSIKEEIKTKFTQNFRDLVDTLNAIATQIKLATKQEILVIVDDLDKFDVEEVDRVFQKNLKALLEPKFIIIYTLPIATIREAVLRKHIEDETGNEIFVMPVLKLYAKGVNRQPDGKPEAAAMQVLQSVITRRIDADLLEDGIVEKIALSSGGVLRDVVRIAQRCCSEVLVKLRRMKRQKQSIDHVRIDQDILQESLDKLRNDIQLGLSKTDREILVQVYNQFIPENPKEEAFLILLHTVVVIEYRNRESWYDVHPLIMEQLKIEKLIP